MKGWDWRKVRQDTPLVFPVGWTDAVALWSREMQSALYEEQHICDLGWEPWL